MRIAVIEDMPSDLESMKLALEQAGHEVLAILVAYGSFTQTVDGAIKESKANKIVSAVKKFAPEKVLLDHSLDMPYNGEQLARELGIEKARLIGTSTSFSQDYCGHHFWGKDTSLRDGDTTGLLKSISS